MYSKQCKKPQVQKNSPSTLFRVLTALKLVKTGFQGNFLSLKHMYALILHIMKVLKVL